MLGSMRKSAQDFDGALTYLNRALAIHPKDLTARKLLASLKLQMGAIEQAVALLEQIVTEAPDAVDAHVQLATAYNRLKRKDDADRERAIVDRLNREIQEKQSARAKRERGGTAPVSVIRTLRQGAAALAALLALSTDVTGDQGASRSARQEAHSPPPAQRPRSSIRSCRPPPTRGVRTVGRRHCALRQGGEAQARLRRGLLVPGRGLLHAREISRMPGRVQARDTPLAGERRCVRVPRSVRVRPQGLRPRAAAPAAIAHPRRRQGCPCVVSYHAAIIMTRIEQYEQALQTLGEFAAAGNDSPRVIEAMGIATLRMAMLPNEVPPDRREMVLMAGRGSYMMATRSTAAAGTAFQAIVERYPETPECPLRLRRVPAARAAGQGDRAVQARAGAPAESCAVAAADCLPVFEREERRGGAALGETGRRGRPEFVRVAQGAWRRASRDGRYRGRASRAAGCRAAGARQSQHASCRWPEHSNAPAVRTTRSASARSSRDWIA